MKTYHSRTILLGLMLNGLLLPEARAANSTPTTDDVPTTSASGSQVQQLENVVVTEVPLDDSIMSTARDLSSVYGTDLSVLDTPRAIGTITKEQVLSYDDLSINRVNQYASGLSNMAGYGVEGIPFIRGDLGEVYENDIRKANNRNGFPVNFNSVDAVDIIKGPASAVFGPAYNGGGYLNFTTKQPMFDRQHVFVSLDFGTYVPGGASFKNYAYTLDVGGPISDKLAYRISLNEKDAASYYKYAKDEESDLYVALTYKPSSVLTFAFNAEAFTSNFTEVGGTNRPTQALIDNNIYTTGPAIQGPYGGTYGYEVPSATAGMQKIYGYDTDVTLGAGAEAKDVNAELTTTLFVNSDFSIVNRSYFEDFKRQDIEYTYYVEVLPYDRVAENRTEAHVHFVTPFKGSEIQQNLNAGVSFRLDQVEAYNSYNLEALSAYDLTQPLADRSIFAFIPTTTFPSVNPLELQIPGTGAFGEPSTASPTLGNYSQPNTKVSSLFTASIFAQHDVKFNDHWRLFIGARVNQNHATAHDPLPPPDTPPASSSISPTQTSFNASLSYKPVEAVTTYVTYNRTDLIAIGGVGGLNFLNGELQSSDFHSTSDLYEAGIKVEPIPRKLLGSVAVYYQKRTVGSIVGQTDDIKTRGIETDVTYEPNRFFNIFANLTYMEANYIDLLPTVAATPAGFATDRPLGDFNGFANLPIANYRVPGVPHFVFNAYANFQFSNGLGFRIGPHVESSQDLDFSNNVIIPAQYYLNCTVSYHHANWEVALDLRNFTNQRNWVPVDTEFTAGDEVLQSLPFNASLHFRIRF